MQRKNNTSYPTDPEVIVPVRFDIHWQACCSTGGLASIKHISRRLQPDFWNGSTGNIRTIGASIIKLFYYKQNHWCDIYVYVNTKSNLAKMSLTFKYLWNKLIVIISYWLIIDKWLKLKSIF